MVGSFSYFVLAAPSVQTAGRGLAHLRIGAHSTCKLIFESCAGFYLDIKVINPHMFYIWFLLSSLNYENFICMLRVYWFDDKWDLLLNDPHA